jgi:phosphoribosylamine--glycine ligase
MHSIEEALEYCNALFAGKSPAIVIEEKLQGEEFTLQSFCDGQHVVDTVVVQDHKRAFDGDVGPNTGGMGSYSCEDHKLPFLSDDIIMQASNINSAVANALFKETGQEYKVILYGGFMLTADGLRLIEYNARFGDPEAMNVLPLLKTDFNDVCKAIVGGTLDKISVEFEKKATVCKYIVPKGYPMKPAAGERVDISDLPPQSDKLRIYYAAVDKKADGLYLTGSRAIALVGIGETLKEAEKIAEEAASRVRGSVFHRKDIGSAELVQSRVEHMKTLVRKKEHLAVA